MDYLELLLRYSLRNKDWDLNISGIFTATLINSVNNEKILKIELHDPEGTWFQFDILKEIIETTAYTG